MPKKTSARPTRKAAQSTHKAVRPTRKAAQPMRKAAQPKNKPAQPVRKAARPTHALVQTVPALVEAPQERFRPEYLGTPYVLSTSVPNYMPRGEAELADWIDNYLKGSGQLAARYPAVFGSTAQFSHGTIANVWQCTVPARANVEHLIDLSRSWRAFKNILFYASEHTISPLLPAPPAPELRPIPMLPPKVGIVGMIDWQVRTLRVQPNFNQTDAELLGIIPKAPPSIDLNTLDPAARARFTGGAVVISFRGAQSIRGVTAARIVVDRGNGKTEFVAITNQGRFTDHHPLPDRPCVWTYYVQYMLPDGSFTGLNSEATVTVRPSQANQ